MAQWRGNQRPIDGSFRNLTKNQLGGVIFGCTKDTIRECLSKQLFGLPFQHFVYVQKIDIRLPLFLFNYSDRKLHGIFEAASCGQLNIDPYGWTSQGSQRTRFPAQVQVTLRLQCDPLSEDKFKHFIKDNYYSSKHMWFELDHVQTNKLICLLTSFAVNPLRPSSTSNERPHFYIAPSSEEKKNSDEADSSKNEPRNNPEVSLSPVRESDSSVAAPHPDISENYQDLQDPKEKNKGLFLEKLKDLAHTHEHEDNNLTKADEQLNLQTCQNLEQQTFSEEKRDIDFLASSSCQPTLIQLMHEVEELRSRDLENSTKICYLEERLDEAHKEIHRLKEHCNMLDSMSGSLNANAGDCDIEIHSPDDSSLDPTEEILLLGGYDENSNSWLSTVQSYFPSRNVVKAHSTMSCIRSNASVTKLDGKIYIFGGDDGADSWHDTVESYDWTDGEWSLCPSLNAQKGSLGGATLEGKIFAIGGGNVEESFSDVEMLDPDIGKWIRTSSMQQKRFAVASVEHNSSIYAVGGFDGNEYLNTGERFDPREYSWMTIASMKSKRSCHSLVVFNEKLYAIGGFNGETMVSSVEVYDPRTGTWIAGEPMKDIRGHSAAVVVKDLLYVIGGTKGYEGILDTVECFKEGEGWRKVRSSIGRRCYLSAIAL